METSSGNVEDSFHLKSSPLVSILLRLLLVPYFGIEYGKCECKGSISCSIVDQKNANFQWNLELENCLFSHTYLIILILHFIRFVADHLFLLKNLAVIDFSLIDCNEDFMWHTRYVFMAINYAMQLEP